VSRNISFISGVGSSSGINGNFTAITNAGAGAAGSAKRSGRSPQELAAIAQLAATDRAVRAHEEAHLAAAGPYATGGPSYIYAVGPDGQLYAVGGDVTLDTSPVPNDPEATIEKARTIEAAANAPANPSMQDRMVAAAAAMMEAAAEREVAQQRKAQSSGGQTQPSEQGDVQASSPKQQQREAQDRSFVIAAYAQSQETFPLQIIAAAF